jgi:hypothetical protein
VMLNIAVLFVAGAAALGEHGAIYATRIPTTWFQVEKIPLMARVPVVLVARGPAATTTRNCMSCAKIRPG